MAKILETPSNQEDPPAASWLFEPEDSPYQPERIERGQGSLPAFIRYMPHAIILWSTGYVFFQAESNLVNYVTAVLLLVWSGYHLLAARKKWPPFP